MVICPSPCCTYQELHGIKAQSPQTLEDRGGLGIFLGYADDYTPETIHVLPKQNLKLSKHEVYDHALAEQTRQRTMALKTALTPDVITQWTREESNKLIRGEQ